MTPARSPGFLVMNPSSRSFGARFLWTRILERLEQAGADFDFALTRGEGDAARLAAEAVARGFDTVVAVGGDGTINEVINGLFPEGASQATARLGVLYTGTSPDFCGYHGIPTDPDAAVDLLLSGKSRPVDVCRIVHRHATEDREVHRTFSCCANFGLGAAVARGSNSGLRQVWGDFAGTLLSLLSAILAYRPPEFRIRVDGRETNLARVYNIFVGKSTLVASGIRLRLESGCDDGRLYFLPIHGIQPLRLLAVLPSVYTGWITRRFPAIRAREIEILDGKGADEVEYDGDPRGRLPARISILPRALELVRP